MKIAIIASTFPPYAGGIGNVAFNNARELAGLGHDVTVFTPDYRPSDAVLPDENNYNFKLVRLRSAMKYGNAAFVPELKKYLFDFDIIHLHYPFFGGAEVVWCRRKKIKKNGGKIILHYHMDLVGSGIFKLIFLANRILSLPRMIKMADRIIVTSLDYAKNSDLKKWLKKEKDKFYEVPNGVDLSVFGKNEKDELLMKKHSLGRDDRIILFVGGLDRAHYFKGVENLIEAAARLPLDVYSWKLIIVGDGDLKTQYMSLADQLRLERRIIFTGAVSNVVLAKYYNLADVVVLPSIDKSEAFGMVLVEAMASGRPVIASNLPGVRSVVVDTINGLLVEPGDIDDLAGKINYLLAEPSAAHDFGRRGLRLARAKYDWRRLAEVIAEIYKS